jgi:hypothetical protein
VRYDALLPGPAGAPGKPDTSGPDEVRLQPMTAPSAKSSHPHAVPANLRNAMAPASPPGTAITIQGRTIIESPTSRNILVAWRHASMTVAVALAIVFLADFLLNFSSVLFDIARRFLGRLAGDLSDALLNGALDLVLHTFSAILVHKVSPAPRHATLPF